MRILLDTEVTQQWIMAMNKYQKNAEKIGQDYSVPTM